MHLRLLTILVTYAVWLSASVSLVLGQEKKTKDAAEVLSEARVRQFTALLKLTEDQQQKVRPIVLEEFKSVQAVKDDDKLTLQDKLAKQATLREASKTKIKALLTPDQLARWEEVEKQGQKKKQK